MVRDIGDSVKVAGQLVQRSTLSGIQLASAKSGVSFQYLVAKAAQESSLQSDAQAATSSAAGLFQFTRGTWLEMLKRYGAQYGYGDLAQKIATGADGKPAVKDHGAEQRILALREDPEASALMAAEYARDNATALQQNLGRDADASDLYLAHFLGASGATQLLATANDTPEKSAASLMPAAAKSNASVFYTPEGRARSAAEVVELVRARFDGQMDRYADLAPEDTAPALAHPPRQQPTVERNAGPMRMAELRQGGDASDPTRAAISWFILEELGKLIAQKPMAMTEGNDIEGLTTSGLQGSDWTAAMTKDFAPKDTPASRVKPPTTAPKGDADMAAQAYGAAYSHVAPFANRPRRDDQN